MSGTETIYEGRFLRMSSRNGWEFVQRVNSSGVVGIVAITDERELVLVEQFRKPVGRTVIELPAGLAGDDRNRRGESLIDAAKRELLEETGFEAANWEPIGHGYTSAGLSDEAVTLFLATGLTQTGKGGGDGHEDIAVHLIARESVQEWLRKRVAKGVGVDLKVYHAVCLLCSG